MSDLIDRQAAIDALDGEITVTGSANAEAVRGYVRLVADRLKRMPSVQPEPKTCCGYDVNKLIVFATACRQQGVKNGDLKAFANNCIFAWNVMSGEIAKTIEDIMRGQSDD